MTPDSTVSDEIRRFQTQYDDHPESLVFARLADAYRKAGELERGLEVVEEGLVRHPAYLSGHIVRARILRQMERPVAAAAAFHRVLTLDPQNLVALRSLGALARERGDTREARRWYARLAELEPLDEGVRTTLEMLGSATVAAPPVEAERDGGAEPRPVDVPGGSGSGEPAPVEGGPGLGGDRMDDEQLLTATMAELYMRQGLFEDAERIYRRLVRLRPEDEPLRERLETVRARMGAKTPRGRKARKDRPGAPGAGTAGVGAEAVGAGTDAAGSRDPADGPEVTIRRYLRELLAGRAPIPELPDGSRPSAFDAWLDRHRAL